MKLFKAIAIFLGLSLGAANVYAETASNTIKQMTSQVIDVVLEAQKDPHGIDVFMPKLDEMMSDYADFDRIAQLIMGSHKKQATADQITRFGAVFKTSMIGTYAKSFLLYDGETVTTFPVAAKYASRNRVPVRQEVKDIAGGLRIIYTMEKRGDKWLMSNISVNGVNLGKAYQRQFDAAMRSGKTIDEVIADWNAQ